MPDSPLEVMMNTGGIAGTNAFLIADSIAKVAVIFDARNSSRQPFRFAVAPTIRRRQ